MQARLGVNQRGLCQHTKNRTTRDCSALPRVHAKTSIGATAQRDPFAVAVCALGIAQITAWGTSYYCLGVLATAIAAEMKWSRSFVYLGFTVSLLAMGVISSWAGRAIDRYGPLSVMSVGTVIVSIGL